MNYWLLEPVEDSPGLKAGLLNQLRAGGLSLSFTRLEHAPENFPANARVEHSRRMDEKVRSTGIHRPIQKWDEAGRSLPDRAHVRDSSNQSQADDDSKWSWL
jgi:hypothetical protein